MPFHYPKVLENGQQPRFRSQHQGFWSARDRNATTIMATSTFVRNFPQNHETRQNRNRGRYLKPCNLAVPLKTHNNNLQTKVQNITYLSFVNPSVCVCVYNVIHCNPNSTLL